ncbi:hypothetical protein WJ972_06340 [Achromobacter insuavis]
MSTARRAALARQPWATAPLLGGTGTLGGSVTVQTGGTLAPGGVGAAPGTLTIGGDLTLQNGSALAYSFGQAGVVGGPFNDLTNVGGNLALGGTLNVQTSVGGARSTPASTGSSTTPARSAARWRWARCRRRATISSRPRWTSRSTWSTPTA